MKVKVSISQTIECVIDDKFRELAVPESEWAKGTISTEAVNECISAVEEAAHVPFWDNLTYEEAIRAERDTGVIVSVQSAENGEIMLEA